MRERDRGRRDGAESIGTMNGMLFQQARLAQTQGHMLIQWQFLPKFVKGKDWKLMDRKNHEGWLEKEQI